MAEYIEREAARQAHIKASLTTRLIDAIPAADVAEVRHGRWILIRRQAASAIFKCSECGREELFDAYHRLENTPYCHCGARMDKDPTCEQE